jgi:hypothetical protein
VLDHPTLPFLLLLLLLLEQETKGLVEGAL